VPQPTVASTPTALLTGIEEIVSLADGGLVIRDEARLRSDGIRDLVWTATFTEDDATRDAARWIIAEAASQLGAGSASIHDLYMARGRGEIGGFTVPALNLRTQVFDMAAATFRAAAAREVGTVILELARSEQEYTFQRPGEYLTSVLAGAVAAGWSAPVFIQGDHYQFNAKKYTADPETTAEGVRKLVREAIAVGYGNIDIDSSTLVDLLETTVDDQQRVNYTRAAEIAELIRSLEPADVTISIGGEIGEVGKENSTEEELRAYLEGFRRELDRMLGPATVGLSKVSVQTGTSHGGVPLPGGGVAEVKLDFGTLERLSAVARDYGLAGAVQHGASTLPDELFHRFPAIETAEIHLATGFQNLLYEHPTFPADLHAEIETWCATNCADERKADETETQFLYKTRKKALGPYKRTLWELPTKDEIIAAQEAKIGYLMEQLAVQGTAESVARYVRLPRRTRPMPGSLAEQVTAAT
jgi:fructose-bisphosphate aldolase, class II